MQEHTTIPFPYPQLTAEDPLTGFDQDTCRKVSQDVSELKTIACNSLCLYQLKPIISSSLTQCPKMVP